MTRVVRALALALVVVQGGCSAVQVEFFPDDESGDGGADLAIADARVPGDGAPGDRAPDMVRGMDGGCLPTHLGDGNAEGCAASRAAALFRFALCSCETLAPDGEITTQAIDSSGGTAPPLRAAAIGTNGSVSCNMPLSIGGALYAASSVSTVGAVSVAESLRAGGSVQAATNFTVGGDAWVAGSVAGPVAVAGTLSLPGGAQVSGGATAGNIVRMPVTVAPPCDCSVLPVATLVAQHAGRNNDNATIHLEASDYMEFDLHRGVELPCGAFYISGITASGEFTITAHGRAALYIDGALTIGGALRIVIDPGAELDLFVSGAITLNGGSLGDSQRPTALRIWDGSQGSLLLSGRPAIAGTLHAPQAELHAPAGIDLRGPALVRDLRLDGSRLSLTYDRGLLSAGTRACGTRAESPIP